MTDRTTHWRTHPIADLVDILDGERIPVSARERAARCGDVPYYGATGQVGWIDAALFDEELVLLGEDGVQFFDPNKAKAFRITGRSWVNNHAHVLRPRGSEVDGRYLTYYLNQLDYRGLANRTTRLKLTQTAMRRIEVSAPPIDEQRRIVDILEDHLSRLDAAEAGVLAVEQRSGFLESSALADAWQSAERSGTRHLVSDIGAVVTGSTPSARSGEVFGSDVPFATPSDIGGGRLIDNVSRGLSTFGARQARLLAPRSVLAVCIGATLGKIGWTDQYLATNQQVNALTPRPDLASAEFVAALMTSPQFQADMHMNASNTTLPILNKSRFSRLTLPIPSITEQQLLLQRLVLWRESIDRLGGAARASRSRTIALRRALLQAAFSGRLTSLTSDDELEGLVAST